MAAPTLDDKILANEDVRDKFACADEDDGAANEAAAGAGVVEFDDGKNSLFNKAIIVTCSLVGNNKW